MGTLYRRVSDEERSVLWGLRTGECHRRSVAFSGDFVQESVTGGAQRSLGTSDRRVLQEERSVLLGTL